MSEMIDDLRQDHKNIIRLLTLLEKQTSNLASGSYADYQLISDIMQYFVTFPDIYHHPHEDLVFGALKQRENNLSAIIDAIHDEHQVMASAAEIILDEIIQIQGNAIFSREIFVGRLQDYITLYYSHIEKEETELFSIAESRLQDEDWRKINVAMNMGTDPLFGKVLHDEYQNLFKAILTEVVEE